MEPLVKEVTDVTRVIDAFYRLKELPFEFVGHFLEEYRGRVQAGENPLVIWDLRYAQMGRAIMDRYQKGWGVPIDVDKFAQLLLDKHRKYGPRPIVLWGNLGIAIRIYSKHERFQNMATLTTLPEDTVEPMSDTLIDMLGYCVLGFLYTERNRS